MWQGLTGPWRTRFLDQPHNLKIKFAVPADLTPRSSLPVSYIKKSYKTSTEMANQSSGFGSGECVGRWLSSE